MKKILFLSPMPPPYYGSAMSSGACFEILKNSGKFEVRNVKINIPTGVNDSEIKIGKFLGAFGVLKKIKFELKSFKPNLIYFVPATSGFGLVRDYLFVRMIKKNFDGEILFHVRSRMIDWNSFWGKKMYEGIFRDESVIILDECLRMDLRELVSDENVFVLPNAIENEVPIREFDKIVISRRGNDKLRILFLSNMDESKGWFKLLEACRILKKNDFDFECNFVGAWSRSKDEKKFFDFVGKNSLSGCVKYLGRKIGDEKNKILKESDVLVFPTEYKLETFGRVMIEGMMFGLPVIANGVASIPKIIQDGKTGFVLEENSPMEIVECLVRLRDGEMRERMGKDGRKRFLKEYEIRKYRRRFLRIFDEVIHC